MTRSHFNLEFEEIAPEIALELLGEPKQKTTTHWRWGNKGSLAFELETASFFDFESNQGGGVTWLIERQGLSPKDVLSLMITSVTLTKQPSNASASLLSTQRSTTLR